MATEQRGPAAAERPVERLDDRSAALLLPRPTGPRHKGDVRELLVVAGSLDYAGAPLLVCQAAGRAGAGLVTLAVPESLPAALRGEGRRGDDARARRG